MQETELSPKLAFSIKKYMIFCFICYYEIDYQGQKESKFSIIKTYTTQELTQIFLPIATTKASKKIVDLDALI